MVIYEAPFYETILFVFTFDFKEVFINIFVERHLLYIPDTPAIYTQNFSRNIVTERRREILRWRREIFVLLRIIKNHE